MGEHFEVFWDESEAGNAVHIAEHGVSMEEVDAVLRRGFDDREPDRSIPGRWIAKDYTDTGRRLVVAFELERVEELHGWLVTPVTAFDVE